MAEMFPAAAESWMVSGSGEFSDRQLGRVGKTSAPDVDALRHGNPLGRLHQDVQGTVLAIECQDRAEDTAYG
jgi:hypothetical protein